MGIPKKLYLQKDDEGELEFFSMDRINNDDELYIHVDFNVNELSDEVAKLRKAVQDGVYDARSIVGDAVLRMEGILISIRLKE